LVLRRKFDKQADAEYYFEGFTKNIFYLQLQSSAMC